MAQTQLEVDKILPLANQLQEKHPDVAEQLRMAHTLLSNPGVHFFEVPAKTIEAELNVLKSLVIRTSARNRTETLEGFRLQLHEDTFAIKKKLRELQLTNEESLLYAAASMKVLREITSGIAKKVWELEKSVVVESSPRTTTSAKCIAGKSKC